MRRWKQLRGYWCSAGLSDCLQKLDEMDEKKGRIKETINILIERNIPIDLLEIV
jgi:hypothetical protein